MTTIGVSASVIGAAPAFAGAEQLLKETFKTPVTNCGGWGKWEAPPSVTANSGADPATFPNGITIPARSVIVHPGTDRDVAVGWKSPIVGKVSVRATIAHAHPAGGNGVSWRIVQERPAGRKLLAYGRIERGGT